MLRLPKKIGPFTLMRKLGADGVTESYAGILDEPAGKQVVVRKLAAFLLMDPVVRTGTESRIQDLKAIRHPTLVPILDLVSDGEDRYALEEWVDAVDLQTVIQHCIDNHREVPANVYLNLATQVCNGLEALHGRPGSSSGAEHVLHLALKPESVFVTAQGKLLVGNYGLTPTPTALPKAGVSGATSMRMEYLSPEQTQPDQSLTPASDIFSLGSVLYELLTLEPLFRAESNLQTIHRVRRAEVTAQLLRVKELMPGLDKVLYRALSLNPRHRYQRAFVLREDLRGLMAGYSFAHISDETATFLGPLFESQGKRPAASNEEEVVAFDDTAAILRHSLAQGGKDPQSIGDAHEDSGAHDAPLKPSRPQQPPQDTGAFVAAARAGVTLAPDDETSTTQPRPENIPGPETSWVKGGSGPTTTWDEAPPGARPQQDSTTWFPVAGADAAPRGAAPTIGEFDEERPTDVRSEPAPSRPAPTAVPAPTPTEHAETTFDGYTGSQRRGPNTLLIYGAAAAAALVAMLVCFGIVGVGGIVGTVGVGGTDGGDAVAVAPEPAPVPGPEPETVATAPAPSPAPTIVSPAPPPPTPVATAPSPAPVPVAPAPRPAPAPVSVASAPRPAPAPTFVAPTTPSPRPAPAPRPTVLPAPAPTATSLVGTEEDVTMDLGDLSAYSDKAYRGALTDTERTALDEIDAGDPDYTRAQVLLYQDAKARDDLADRERYIGNVMSLPENQYNPQFLTEQAEIAIRHEDYDTALEKANLAERHWARLPSELIFSRKAMIYEIQASSYQGKFYNSGGEDLDSLYQAIRAWEKYQRHVETRSREDLTVRAEDQLAKLYDMKKRLEQP